MGHTEQESPDGPERSVGDERMFDALDHGAPPLPAVIPPGSAAIAAAGQWGRYGSVVVLFREGDGELYDDTYLMARSTDGRWQSPGVCGGGGMPEWVLNRPAEPLPTWRGNDLVDLSAQLAQPGKNAEVLTELTVMATKRVATVQVSYAGDVIDLPVPTCGLVTVPHAVHHANDVAEFRGFGGSGDLIAVTHYQPLAGWDHEYFGWPDASLWAE
ncbi:hypothetical protein HS041_25580 [Planomonospora sp. ID67723]|uniref:hypothetical protein n=1 Tax=Planomonospora sp. ID67723 TaxID=2738134 RepID=UPI0018C39C3E|nr:hypothetical protein [Planomonospora sp. ID67723]MBG0831136.1 hypothetical protein [Planomonospora sp. ID67723]